MKNSHTNNILKLLCLVSLLIVPVIIKSSQLVLTDNLKNIDYHLNEFKIQDNLLLVELGNSVDSLPQLDSIFSGLNLDINSEIKISVRVTKKGDTEKMSIKNYNNLFSKQHRCIFAYSPNKLSRKNDTVIKKVRELSIVQAAGPVVKLKKDGLVGLNRYLTIYFSGSEKSLSDITILLENNAVIKPGDHGTFYIEFNTDMGYEIIDITKELSKNSLTRKISINFINCNQNFRDPFN